MQGRMYPPPSLGFISVLKRHEDRNIHIHHIVVLVDGRPGINVTRSRRLVVTTAGAGTAAVIDDQ